jgi:single-stranded DNA-binding protein
METPGGNKVYLYGLVVTEPQKSRESYGEDYYEMQLSVKRLSSIVDTIPVTVPKTFVEKEKIALGSRIAVIGEFRSYNKIIDGRSKLMLSVFVKSIIKDFDDTNPNVIEVKGYICKAPIYRTTPFNREIADLLIASNRPDNKSDYLPAIAWGRNARFAQNIAVGEIINIVGRIQSREYQKKLDNDQTETRTAYEISINQISHEAIDTQIGDTNFTIINKEAE